MCSYFSLILGEMGPTQVHHEVLSISPEQLSCQHAIKERNGARNSYLSMGYM